MRRVQMGVSIWGAVYLHSMEGWALSGADVQAPLHGALEKVWLHCDEAQQVGCLWGWEGCPLVATSHNLQSVVISRVDEAGMSTVAPDRRTVGYSPVECTRARVAIRILVAPAPQPEPASHLDVSFSWSDSRCLRYVSDLSNFTPRKLDWEQKGRIFLLYLTSLSSRLASLLLRWKAADTICVVLRFSFQVWR